MLGRLVEVLRAAPQSIAVSDSTDPQTIRAAVDMVALNMPVRTLDKYKAFGN